jgi:succinyl-CoA synthetase beta subunit
MNIHEYQAKGILKAHGVRVPEGKAVYSVAEAKEVAQELGGSTWVVKAQIHAGGRGKAGGVKVARSLEEVESFAKEILGKTLVTHQTGPEGKEVQRLLIEEGVAIKKEYYLGMVIDRATQKVTMMASSEGGVEIEEVAAATPEKIFKATIDPATGFLPSHGRSLAYRLGFREKEKNKRLIAFMRSLYEGFTKNDAELAEINPLVETEGGELIALDAKMGFDDNAGFRHQVWEELRDPSEESDEEREAKKFGLSYISLDGNIGCMVNGAGLAMATMDVIKLAGSEPANFLDVGGGASVEKVSSAFRIILSDPKVEAILVNIFGGIMRCDVIAEGIVAAAKEVGLKVPLVVRLEGTKVDEGKAILEKSDLKLVSADSLKDAAEKVVSVAGK